MLGHSALLFVEAEAIEASVSAATAGAHGELEFSSGLPALKWTLVAMRNVRRNVRL
jgi:hypothetical protein